MKSLNGTYAKINVKDEELMGMDVLYGDLAKIFDYDMDGNARVYVAKSNGNGKLTARKIDIHLVNLEIIPSAEKTLQYIEDSFNFLEPGNKDRIISQFNTLYRKECMG